MFHNSSNLLINSLSPQILHQVILQLLIKSIKFWSIILSIISRTLILTQELFNIISQIYHISHLNFPFNWSTFIYNTFIFSGKDYLEITEILLIFLLFFLFLILIFLFFFFLLIVEITWSSWLENYSYVYISVLFY